MKIKITFKHLFIITITIFYIRFIRSFIKSYKIHCFAHDELLLTRCKNEIRNVMKDAWKNYYKHAWGYDFLNPLSRKGENLHGLGYTIIDSLDTLLIMDLDDEFQQARKWVNESIAFGDNVSFFEAVIRCVGGLMSAYELTKDQLFLEKAVKLGNLLMNAFKTETGLPRVLIDMKTGMLYDYPWNNESTLLSDAGSCQIEFLALSRYSGNYSYYNIATKARVSLERLGPLPPTSINYNFLFPSKYEYSLDAFGDSYFEYLLKFKYYSPLNDTNDEFQDAINEAIYRMGFTSWETGLDYFAEIRGNSFLHRISHLSFFLPGTLFLASIMYPENEIYSKLASSLLQTGIYLYKMQPTKLGGEKATFMKNYPFVKWDDDTYKLRPELFESMFYGWRIKHDPKLRYDAWKFFKAIEKYCSTGSGYSTVHDTSKKVIVYDDIQDSFFLSETLKYLYLTFCDDDYFSIYDYVFTTQAHPLKRILYNKNK